MTPLPMSRANWALLIALSLLWGGSFFFVGVAVAALPVLTIVWLRVALAAAVLALVLAATGTPFPPRRTWGALAAMGVLNNAIPFTAFVLAQGQIASGLAAILNATTPLFTLLIAAMATGDERLTPAKLSGLTLGLAGVTTMIGGAALTDGASHAGAQALCLLAALSYGCAAVWGRRFRGLGLAPLATAFGMLCASALILLPLMLLHDRPLALPLPAPGVVAALAGLAIFSTALAYILYFRLLASAGAVNLSLVTFLIPPSAIALGLLFLGESLAPRHIAGLALILAGLAAVDGRLFSRKPTSR